MSSVRPDEGGSTEQAPVEPVVVDDRYGPSALVTPANAVTAIRLLFSPALLVLIVREPSSWAAVGLWTLLAFSDGIDGALARRHGTTRSGAFLDPLAEPSGINNQPPLTAPP